MRIARLFPLFCLLFAASALARQGAGQIVVDARGKGDFRTIQGAINSLSDSAATPRVIYIRKGVYREKVYIEKHNIELVGEDREGTVITADIARDEWRCAHRDDWGVATLNLDGNDITLRNITVANDYGFNNKATRTIACPADTVAQKQITPNGHQMALRSFKTTRLRAFNCRFRAFAGDTVSPWNLNGGMFYFKDCYMEGGVDFYCPRGWAWAENCHFYTNTGPAAIWHDGSANPDYKTVLRNCTFDGYAGFNLGRYHKDAQFYLLGCRFSANMADRDIYLVPTSNTILWGRRVFYSGCSRQGGNFAWFADNLHTAPGNPATATITPAWVFGTRWNPETN